MSQSIRGHHDSLSWQKEIDGAAAADRLSGRIHRTPVLSSRTINGLVGGELHFKCENFQRSGSFKIRGAMNAVFALDDETASRGVVAHSSGNHAAAVALAAQCRGIPAYLAVGHNVARPKLRACESYGAHIHYCEPTLAEREKTAARLLEACGGSLIHPFDNPLVIAGQGTCARELLEELPSLDLLVAPVSGGGLLSGCALAARAINPTIKIYGAEPVLADDAARSLASGTLQENLSNATIADGLRASLSPRTFAILQAHLEQIVTVEESDIIEAMRLFWNVCKALIEPSSAVALAALLTGKIPAADKRTGVILSGGNVDLDTLPWHGLRS